MTPEERARAAAITDSIAAESAARRADRIPGVSPEPQSKGFFYAAIFAFVLAAHVAGFLGYQHVQAKRTTERERQHAQALADAAQARANANRLAASMRAASAPAPAYQNTQYAGQQSRQRNTGITLTGPNGETVHQSPRPIEYNVYRATPPTPNRAQAAPEQRPTVTDRSHAHRSAAIHHVVKNGGGYVRVTESKPVPGWDGRYRTTGDAQFYKYSSNRTPSPRKFEVLTQENGEEVNATDINIKW